MYPDYNRIAHQYDWLAKLVFSSKLEIAKKANIKLIKPGQKVLIVGGGTGSILEYLADMKRSLVIDYIDVSDQMIRNARKREFKGDQVSFYSVAIEEFHNSGYDIIITNFFFDQFTEGEALRILTRLKHKLNQNGLVLFSDFLNPKDKKNRTIHALMKLYFRFTINLKVKQYPDYQKVFISSGFRQVSSRLFRSNILIQLYTK